MEEPKMDQTQEQTQVMPTVVRSIDPDETLIPCEPEESNFPGDESY